VATPPVAPSRPVPAARPASVGGYLDSEVPTARAAAVPVRRGSQELLDGSSRPLLPSSASSRAASREALAYEPVRHQQQQPVLQADPRSGSAAAASRSASREQLDAESLYAPRSVPRSASRELLDRGAPGAHAVVSLQPPSYERRFQTNPSSGNLQYATKPAGDAGRSRSSSVASLSAPARSAPPPKFRCVPACVRTRIACVRAYVCLAHLPMMSQCAHRLSLNLGRLSQSAFFMALLYPPRLSEHFEIKAVEKYQSPLGFRTHHCWR